MRGFTPILMALVALAACQPIETVYSDAERVTYRYDPSEVSLSRVYSAATDKCAFSARGSRPAVAVRDTMVDGLREIEFICRQRGYGLDLGRAVGG